jgi:small conductance mechanosensitive channel
MADSTNEIGNVILDVVAEDPEEAAQLIGQLQQYSDLFVRGLYLIVIGVVIVFLLQRFASRILIRRMKNRRLIRVIFGFLYVFILVVTGLLAMDRIGMDTGTISKVAFLLMLAGAVLAYFLAPFLPRLPFTIGHMVEIDGELGHVDSISNFHTIVRRLDGTLVFFPNPLVLSKKLLNFSYTPSRRVEIKLSVNTDSDLRETIAVCLRLMNEDDRFLNEPAPPATYVVNVTAAGVDLLVFGWVKNADWFRARSDLYLKLVDAFLADDHIALSLPRQEVSILPPGNPTD